MLEQRRFQIKS